MMSWLPSAYKTAALVMCAYVLVVYAYRREREMEENQLKDK